MIDNVMTDPANSLQVESQAQPRPRREQKRGYNPWQTSALLTADEERELAARIKAGDAAARERLILANLRLVAKLAHRFTHTGVSLDDLIQEGTRGLIRAVDCFDPQTHNTRFSTYAMHWIRKGIQVALEASGPIIRVPTYLLRLRSRFERVMDDLRSEEIATGQDDPTNSPSPPRAADEAMASRLNVTSDRLERLRQAMIRRSSLYQTDAEGEEVVLEAMAAKKYRPDREIELAEGLSELHRAIDCLSAVESLLIRYRFGMIDTPRARRRKIGRNSASASEATDRLAPGRTRTYRTVSQALGISVHRVREIEQGALAKLREVLDPGLLSSFR
jgi:RNA polymerase sigma factor (sigma-70 family)